jgi:hypothetical protein
MDFFDAPRGPRGERSFVLRLSDVSLELRGLDDALAETLERRFGRFCGGGSGGGARLAVEVGRAARPYFIEPPSGPAYNRIVLECDGPRVRYLAYQAAGWFETAGGSGRLLVTEGTYEPADRAVENFVRVAVAWMAAESGGALVHAAGAVRDGRAYLFYGESGAGKSTLSECNRRARIVSDDLSLVLPRPGGGLDLVGSPFRGTYEQGDPVRGRFPLVAGFRIVKDTVAEVRPAARPIALAELVGNLPFVAEAFDRRPDLFAKVERAFDGLPMAHLHFRKDDSFWDAIDRAGL